MIHQPKHLSTPWMNEPSKVKLQPTPATPILTRGWVTSPIILCQYISNLVPAHLDYSLMLCLRMYLLSTWSVFCVYLLNTQRTQHTSNLVDITTKTPRIVRRHTIRRQISEVVHQNTRSLIYYTPSSGYFG